METESLYLCIEHGEYFTVKATSLAEAREHAAGWGGEAIRKLNDSEL